jgi:acyl-CoA thioesterase-1
MVSLISTAGESADPKVNVFRRFELMKRWTGEGIPLDSLDDQGNDRLHTGKWATNCVAQALFEAIINAPP